MLGNAWGDFVQYSSKPLREGELVEVIRGGDKVEDRWLAVFPQGLELELNWDGAELPKGVSVEEWNQNAVQLYVEDDLAPFMQGRAKSRVPELTGATVYSFNDMCQLLDNFTAFGLLMGILTLVLALWITSCAFSKRPRRNRWVLWANLALGLLLLVCVPIVLDSVDLPSSLLPRERITDFGAIAGAIDQFFGVLKGFAAQGSQAADDAIHQASTMLWMSVGLAAVMIIIAIGICVAEIIFSRKGSVHYMVKDEQNGDR